MNLHSLAPDGTVTSVKVFFNRIEIVYVYIFHSVYSMQHTIVANIQQRMKILLDFSKRVWYCLALRRRDTMNTIEKLYYGHIHPHEKIKTTR